MYLEKFFFILIFIDLLYANSPSTINKNVFTGSFDFYTEACKKEKVLKASHKVCLPLHIIGKYKISFLLHEPVIQCNAKYYIQDRLHSSYISIDDIDYRQTDFPEKVWKELFLSDIRIVALLESSKGIILDSGGILKEGIETFNAPLSPEWNHFVIYNLSEIEWSMKKYFGTSINLKYVDKKSTIALFKTYATRDEKDILYNFDALADFYSTSLVQHILKEKNKPVKSTKKIEDSKSPQSNIDSLDDIIDQDVNSKSKKKKSTYLSKKSKSIERDYKKEIEHCKKEKPKKYFRCSVQANPHLLYVEDMSLPRSERERLHKQWQIENNREDREIREKCAQEKQEWKRHTYEERVRVWQEKKQICEAKALKYYNDKIKQIQQEENDIDSIWDTDF